MDKSSGRKTPEGPQVPVREMSLTVYGANKIRLNSKLYRFMHTPSYLRIFIDKGRKKLTLVPSDKSNDETWAIRKPRADIYGSDTGAYINGGSCLAELLYADSGKSNTKHTIIVSDKSTPNHVVIDIG